MRRVTSTSSSLLPTACRKRARVSDPSQTSQSSQVPPSTPSSSQSNGKAARKSVRKSIPSFRLKEALDSATYPPQKRRRIADLSVDSSTQETRISRHRNMRKSAKKRPASQGFDVIDLTSSRSPTPRPSPVRKRAKPQPDVIELTDSDDEARRQDTTNGIDDAHESSELDRVLSCPILPSISCPSSHRPDPIEPEYTHELAHAETTSSDQISIQAPEIPLTNSYTSAPDCPSPSSDCPAAIENTTADPFDSRDILVDSQPSKIGEVPWPIKKSPGEAILTADPRSLNDSDGGGSSNIPSSSITSQQQRMGQEQLMDGTIKATQTGPSGDAELSTLTPQPADKDLPVPSSNNDDAQLQSSSVLPDPSHSSLVPQSYSPQAVEDSCRSPPFLPGSPPPPKCHSQPSPKECPLLASPVIRLGSPPTKSPSHMSPKERSLRSSPIPQLGSPSPTKSSSQTSPKESQPLVIKLSPAVLGTDVSRQSNPTHGNSPASKDSQLPPSPVGLMSNDSLTLVLPQPDAEPSTLDQDVSDETDSSSLVPMTALSSPPRPQDETTPSMPAPTSISPNTMSPAKKRTHELWSAKPRPRLPEMDSCFFAIISNVTGLQFKSVSADGARAETKAGSSQEVQRHNEDVKSEGLGERQEVTQRTETENQGKEDAELEASEGRDEIDQLTEETREGLAVDERTGMAEELDQSVTGERQQAMDRMNVNERVEVVDGADAEPIVDSQTQSSEQPSPPPSCARFPASMTAPDEVNTFEAATETEKGSSTVSEVPKGADNDTNSHHDAPGQEEPFQPLDSLPVPSKSRDESLRRIRELVGRIKVAEKVSSVRPQSVTRVLQSRTPTPPPTLLQSRTPTPPPTLLQSPTLTPPPTLLKSRTPSPPSLFQSWTPTPPPTLLKSQTPSPPALLRSKLPTSSPPPTPDASKRIPSHISPSLKLSHTPTPGISKRNLSATLPLPKLSHTPTPVVSVRLPAPTPPPKLSQTPSVRLPPPTRLSVSASAHTPPPPPRSGRSHTPTTPPSRYQLDGPTLPVPLSEDKGEEYDTEEDELDELYLELTYPELSRN